MWQMTGLYKKEKFLNSLIVLNLSKIINHPMQESLES